MGLLDILFHPAAQGGSDLFKAITTPPPNTAAGRVFVTPPVAAIPTVSQTVQTQAPVATSQSPQQEQVAIITKSKSDKGILASIQEGMRPMTKNQIFLERGQTFIENIGKGITNIYTGIAQKGFTSIEQSPSLKLISEAHPTIGGAIKTVAETGIGVGLAIPKGVSETMIIPGQIIVHGAQKKLTSEDVVAGASFATGLILPSVFKGASTISRSTGGFVTGTGIPIVSKVVGTGIKYSPQIAGVGMGALYTQNVYERVIAPSEGTPIITTRLPTSIEKSEYAKSHPGMELTGFEISTQGTQAPTPIEKFNRFSNILGREVFTMGIGANLNRPLIQGISKVTPEIRIPKASDISQVRSAIIEFNKPSLQSQKITAGRELLTKEPLPEVRLDSALRQKAVTDIQWKDYEGWKNAGRQDVISRIYPETEPSPVISTKPRIITPSDLNLPKSSSNLLPESWYGKSEGWSPQQTRISYGGAKSEVVRADIPKSIDFSVPVERQLYPYGRFSTLTDRITTLGEENIPIPTARIRPTTVKLESTLPEIPKAKMSVEKTIKMNIPEQKLSSGDKQKAKWNRIESIMNAPKKEVFKTEIKENTPILETFLSENKVSQGKTFVKKDIMGDLQKKWAKQEVVMSKQAQQGSQLTSQGQILLTKQITKQVSVVSQKSKVSQISKPLLKSKVTTIQEPIFKIGEQRQIQKTRQIPFIVPIIRMYPNLQIQPQISIQKQKQEYVQKQKSVQIQSQIPIQIQSQILSYIQKPVIITKQITPQITKQPQVAKQINEQITRQKQRTKQIPILKTFESGQKKQILKYKQKEISDKKTVFKGRKEFYGYGEKAAIATMKQMFGAK